MTVQNAPAALRYPVEVLELDRSEYLMSRGMKVPKDPVVMRRDIRRLIKRETYERKECEAVQRLVRPGERVLELGGGIGYMSTLIATRTAASEIVSIEANPRLIPVILRMHAANGVGHVRVENAVLSAGSGAPVDFFVRADFLASSMDRAIDPDGVVAVEKVPRRDIRALLAEMRPDVLVCDIEGAEAELLPAADLSGLRAAVVELHPQWIGAAGVRAVFAAFHAAGLTFFPRLSHGKVACFARDW